MGGRSESARAHACPLTIGLFVLLILRKVLFVNVCI